MSDEAISAVDFYWRPGCGFCTMLDRALSRAGVRFVKHDIWSDPGAAEVVRTWARGAETVPTVVIDDVGLVNPSADQVIAVLAKKAPQLVPDGWAPRSSGRTGSLVRRLLSG